MTNSADVDAKSSKTVGRSPLRIAMLVNGAAEKHGSGESWVIAIGREAQTRGHSVHLFSLTPTLPSIAAEMATVGMHITPIASLLRTPVRSARWLARNFDVIHLNLFAPRDSVAAMCYLAWPARVLFVDHVSGPSVLTGVSKARPWYRRILDHVTTFRLASVAGVSNYVRDRARERFPRLRSVTCTIYNGVDTERHTPMDFAEGRSETIVFSVAALHEDKGVDVLIRAFAQIGHSGAKLLIAGDGPARSTLEQLASDLGVASRTSFLGMRNDIHDLMRQADVFVHPAKWQEAFGYTIVEGMAAGVPVIASSVGAVPELITDGSTGVLVPAGDPNALAVAMETLVGDASLRKRLGSAAREDVIRRFGVQMSAARHIDWCEWAVGRRPSFDMEC